MNKFKIKFKITNDQKIKLTFIMRRYLARSVDGFLEMLMIFASLAILSLFIFGTILLAMKFFDLNEFIKPILANIKQTIAWLANYSQENGWMIYMISTLGLLVLYFLVAGLDAWIYAKFGNTFGKKWMGLKIVKNINLNNSENINLNINFKAYFYRNIRLFFYGQALLLPIINLFTMFYQAFLIYQNKPSSYDKNYIQNPQNPQNPQTNYILKTEEIPTSTKWIAIIGSLLLLGMGLDLEYDNLLNLLNLINLLNLLNP